MLDRRLFLGLAIGVIVGSAALGWILAGSHEARGATATASVGVAQDEPEPIAGEGDPGPSLSEEVEALRAELARRRAEAARLREELARVEAERLDREMEFLDFTQAVAAFDLDSPPMRFTKELLDENPGELPPEPVPLDPEEVRRTERAAELARELRALMRAEWVRGLELIEHGELSDEGWLGPVVFKSMDDLGRLTGSLSAHRLRLEGSRTGRLVTLVLEGGEERSGGLSVPFVNGVRRLTLPGVDPAPWIDALPELFTEEDQRAKDDGRWDPEAVRIALNRLLREDATGDVFRLRHLGGVVDGVLRDVHFDVRDSGGSVLRHLFADRCLVAPHGTGVRVQLEDGVSMRGDTRLPFLEGRYRVFLPRARTEVWRSAGIPGISVEPESGEAESTSADG